MEAKEVEIMEITYRQVGDVLLPNLELPAEEKREIGIWGQRHKRYIREHRKGLFSSLVLSGRLDTYLADIDEQAEEMFSRLVKEMAAQEDVTEQLKEHDQMAWVGRMNNIRNRAIEIVNDELICR